MAKSALKKKNGKNGNGKVIPLRPLEDGFEKTLSERRNTEVDQILKTIKQRTVPELMKMAIYSQYKRLRNKALELLPRKLSIIQSVHYTSTYPDVINATKNIIDELKGKSS